jgi:hypothetical protein
LALDLKVTDDYSSTEHEFKVCSPMDQKTCISALANEYRNLRTQSAISTDSVSLEGIGVVDTTRIRSLLTAKTIPLPKGGPFDIVRSDMGETLAYIMLEQNYNTQIGYKSVRDRELIQLPGRGIDIVGIENGDSLTLLLGEAKVSDEGRNPPRVVDYNEDSISNQLIKHIENHEETSKKVWDITRRISDHVVWQLFVSAAIYWDQKMWSNLGVICCGVLLRPLDKYNEQDFGILREKPELVAPAKIRFLIFCFEGDLEKTVSEFYVSAKTGEEEL